mmetsp:Transcript_43118/g.116437  ORF Transcript_43118/g.116437 Transcript_43118/m.116437 type:complete len:258 (-) Transcript_43118:435-1208(-)
MALEAEVRANLEAKLQGMSQEIEEIQTWMEAVLGEPFESAFTDELKDGVKLCEFANSIRPNIIPKVKRSGIAFIQMQNISSFIAAIKALGMDAMQCFDTIDLYKAKDLPKVVQTLYTLGNYVNQNAATLGYSGPMFQAVSRAPRRPKADSNPEVPRASYEAPPAPAPTREMVKGAAAAYEQTNPASAPIAPALPVPIAADAAGGAAAPFNPAPRRGRGNTIQLPTLKELTDDYKAAKDEGAYHNPRPQPHPHPHLPP